MARTEEAKEAFARECRFLPHLAKRAPALIPVPARCGDGWMIYPRLPGMVPGSALPIEVVPGLASFMWAVHSIPIDEAIQWGVPRRNRTHELLAAADRVLPLIPAPLQTPARIWREAFTEAAAPEAVIHGDLWYENILIDPDTRRLCGVLDFEQAGIGDPAWDLATQFHSGRGFAESVFRAYPGADPALWSRAERLFRLRPFEGLDWAARHGDKAEFEESLKKLQDTVSGASG